MKGELISKKHVTKQAAFFVLSLRARLLAIASKHARELSEISDEREMALRLDAIMRSSLDEIAQMPLKVSDEHWIETLDDERDSTNQRRRSDADRLLVFDVVFERPLSLEMQRRRDEVVLAREESFSRLVIRRFCFRNLDLGRLHFQSALCASRLSSLHALTLSSSASRAILRRSSNEAYLRCPASLLFASSSHCFAASLHRLASVSS